MKAADRAVAALRQEGFYVASGEVFGVPNVLRFSVTRDEMLTDALGQLGSLDEEHN